MDKSRETADGTPETSVAEAWQQVVASFERFCLNRRAERAVPG